MATIKYRIYKNNSMAGEKGKYYARAYQHETVCLEELAKNKSEHNTPYSKGTIQGVLKDMVACVRELLLDSKKVKLDNLAIFSIGLTSKPAESPMTFRPSTHIVKATINALGTGEISKKQLDMDARFTEVVEYTRGDVPGTGNTGSDSGGGSVSGSDSGGSGSPSGGGGGADCGLTPKG